MLVVANLLTAWSPPHALLSQRALDSLQRQDFTVVDRFVDGAFVDALLTDIDTLRAQPAVTALAPPSARNGAVEWYELLPQAPPGRTVARTSLYDLVERLQTHLEDLDSVEMHAHCTELKYACYPTGGHYARHVDAMVSGSERERRWSFILYLNKGWLPSAGGKLRVYRDDGGHFDVAPTAGTLVVFRSSTVPHEVSARATTDELCSDEHEASATLLPHVKQARHASLFAWALAREARVAASLPCRLP
eukprot:1125885-Prymnesium_polylepis.1